MFESYTALYDAWSAYNKNRIPYSLKQEFKVDVNINVVKINKTPLGPRHN